MDALRYYLGFNMTPGIGPARLARLTDYFGSVQAAWEAEPGALMGCGLDAKSIESLLATRARLDLDAELLRAERAGVQLLCLESPDYPALLLQIPQPPPLIYVRGTLTRADELALAVVGTRSPTTYGKEATRRVVNDLAAAGITIVSGLALGIDTLAHSSALEAGGRTVAVLAGGVDVPYPERNRRLAEQIVSNGALISEFPLGVQPLPSNFPARNRLISGLSLGTLVVEAGSRSGALITVEFALEQGREVFAVPGEIFSRTSEGTNQLIRNGAAIVTHVQDVLEALNWTNAAAQQEVKQVLPDDPTEAALLELISYEPRHIDELGRSSGLPTPTLSAALAMMELKGMVRQAGAMTYVLARERREEYSC
jgi:DNA processing protein